MDPSRPRPPGSEWYDVSDVVVEAAPKIPYERYVEDLRAFRIALDPPAITVDRVWEKLLLRRERADRFIPTGVEWFDRFAGGHLRRANHYVLAGYPGVGKTTLAVQLGWALAQRVRTWYYCLELSADEVFEVLAGHITGTATVGPEQEAVAYAAIRSSGFRFYEPAGYQPWDARLDEISRTVRAQKIQVVIIDNLSFLVRADKHTYEAENLASAKLKSLAQELDIVVVLVHHLRKPDSDEREPEPTAHTIRGSGAILADASDAWILHHPLDADSETCSRHPVGYLLSGKPRWGRGGKIYVRLEGSARRYSPAQSSEYQRPARWATRRRAVDV